MNDIKELNVELTDATSRSLGRGGTNVSSYTVFSGLNALPGIPSLPHNADNQGLTFFTKPNLNLSYNNVIGIRKLSYLADPREKSMGALIRCMLSPPDFTGYINAGDTQGFQVDTIRSTIIDDQCAFLPISNFLLSLSAPPDIVADVYTSNEGYNKEQISWIDGKPNYFGAYDLTTNFANMEGDPITAIFSTWIEYACRVQDGSMLPFPINIVENRIDYNSRIFRLVLDKSRRYVQRLFSTIAFPTSVPAGAALGVTQGVHLSSESDQIQINWKCMGATYDDPILIKEFNDVVSYFKPDMVNRTTMTLVEGVTENHISRLALLNYKMYPRIGPGMEMEWYCNTANYNLIMNAAENLPLNQSDQSAAPNYPVISPWANAIVPASINQAPINLPEVTII